MNIIRQVSEAIRFVQRPESPPKSQSDKPQVAENVATIDRAGASMPVQKPSFSARVMKPLNHQVQPPINSPQNQKNFPLNTVVMAGANEAKDKVVDKSIAEKHLIYARVASFKGIRKPPDSPEVAEFTAKMSKLGFKAHKSGIFYNEKTGTVFCISQEKNKMMLCFGSRGSHMLTRELKWITTNSGTNAEMLRAQQRDSFRDFLGKKTNSAVDAMNVGEAFNAMVVNCNKGKSEESAIQPVVLGHSSGGRLAQIAASSAGIKGIVFNSRPVGAWARNKATTTTEAKEKPGITAFISEGDFLASKSSRRVPPRFIRAIISKLLPEGAPTSLASESYVIPNVKKENLIVLHYNFSNTLAEIANG